MPTNSGGNDFRVVKGVASLACHPIVCVKNRKPCEQGLTEVNSGRDTVPIMHGTPRSQAVSAVLNIKHCGSASRANNRAVRNTRIPTAE